MEKQVIMTSKNEKLMEEIKVLQKEINDPELNECIDIYLDNMYANLKSINDIKILILIRSKEKRKSNYINKCLKKLLFHMHTYQLFDEI